LGVTNETETSGASSIAVFDNDSLLNGAKLLELLSESIFIRVPRETANEELRHIVGLESDLEEVVGYATSKVVVLLLVGRGSHSSERTE